MNAYAPGSVTTMFSPTGSSDAGSLGVSFTIEDGVTAAIEPAEETIVTVDGEEHSFAPVEIALRQLGVTARVSLSSEIPIGYGFGASGAATLSTLLAANETLGVEHSRDELIQIAHLAEVEAGTGLGDVLVQAQGGLVWNTGEGVQQTSLAGEIEYTAFAGIATPDLLSDEHTIEQISTAGNDCLSRFAPDGSVRDLLALSWEFARQTGLPTEQLTETVERVEQAGGVASMAMVGETVIAAGVQGVLEYCTQVTSDGAHVLD